MAIVAESYKVKLDVFEGPMDLLLHLVKINEMDIYDIPIAEITRQYLDYIGLMQSLDLELAGEFLVMAATLVNIKLRSLLPIDPDAEEDDDEITDIMTAQQLMEQLIQYRKFKEAAGRLREQGEWQAQIFFREVALPELAGLEETLRLDLDKMLRAFSRVVRFVEARGWHLVTEAEYSVEEKIDLIYERIQREPRLDLEDLFRGCGTKVEMIVTLLALLELCRQKSISLNQSGPFTAIYIYRRDPLAESLPAEPTSSVREEDLPQRSAAQIIDADELDDEESVFVGDRLPSDHD
jgi:segregation and condensation protein A